MDAVTGVTPVTKSKENRAQLLERQLRVLLVSALGGNAADYRIFLGELTMYLRGYCRRQLHGLPDEVEDTVQEVLLAVHNQRHTYDAAQPVTAWIHAITRYKLADLFRRRASRESLQVPLDDDSIFASPVSEELGSRRDLAVLLKQLPDRHRLPIQHVKLEGCSVAEAAAQTGMSESAVKVGIHRGMKALAALVRSAK